MGYDSVDQLQRVLVNDVFHYAKDAKKAAGRALGTLVEVITFYLLKSWSFEHSIAIERALAEYGNPEITHNVEYSLHPILREYSLIMSYPKLPITSNRIFAQISKLPFSLEGFRPSSRILLTSTGILRNSCIVAHSSRSHLVATLDTIGQHELQAMILEQHSKPYAMFECKRVGVEEGARKGPQTIEKAKQGAYVAKSVSSLHKIRLATGELRGIIYKSNQEMYSKPYTELIAEIIVSNEPELLRDFILTVGVASNHGNWFTSGNHNKELKVLAQSYDWLIFLTDQGLSDFVTELLLEPVPRLYPARDAFLASYTGEKRKNQFTKVQMNYEADQVLQAYFRDNSTRMEQWFNVIAPKNGSMQNLHAQISLLREKDWRTVHSR